MRRRWQRLATSALLVLFAGTMLPGQALHLFAPCAGHAAKHDHHATPERSADGLPVLADSDAACHDAEDCPVCQFCSQGQLVAPAGAAEIVRPFVATVPTVPHAAPVIRLTALHNPRGPPQA